jgi:hypothetical protein
LQGFYKPFFLRNALDYLNVKERLGDNRFPIDPVVKGELQDLLARAQSP